MHLLVNWVANKWQHWHNILIFGSIVFLLGLKTLHKGNSGSENWPHILQKVHFKHFCQSLGFICGVDTKHKRYPLSKKCPYSELFWSAFSRIWTEYGEMLRISPYSVRMGENAGKMRTRITPNIDTLYVVIVKNTWVLVLSTIFMAWWFSCRGEPRFGQTFYGITTLCV